MNRLVRRPIPRLTRLRPWITPLRKLTPAERLELIQASRYLLRRAEDHRAHSRTEEADAARTLAAQLRGKALSDLTPKEVGDLLLQSYEPGRFS